MQVDISSENCRKKFYHDIAEKNSKQDTEAMKNLWSNKNTNIIHSYQKIKAAKKEQDIAILIGTYNINTNRCLQSYNEKTKLLCTKGEVFGINIEELPATV